MASRLCYHWIPGEASALQKNYETTHPVTKIRTANCPLCLPPHWPLLPPQKPCGRALMEELCEYQVSMAVVNGCDKDRGIIVRVVGSPIGSLQLLSLTD